MVGLFLVWLQSLLLASIAIFFSTFSTVSLSSMITIGFYLVGNNISQIRWVASHLHSSWGSLCLKWVSILFPNFEYFNLGNKITYALPVLWLSTGLSVLYGLFVIALLLTLAGLLIQSREV
jgi:hypothetical protein